MTTYSKETALYDTGAIGDDIEEAGTKADNYLTDVSGGGVMVHPSDDSTSGWKISSALELLKSGVSYIWAGLVNSIATVRIGKETGGHSVIDENGMRVYGSSDGSVQLANIGYGEGAAQSGTATAPYYSLGVRKANSAIGNYSVAEGVNTTASNYASHAEGDDTTASGYASHAEGSGTASGSASHAEGSGATASGSASHAEGFGTTASGVASHAEGDDTTASGVASHAQNTQTIASKNSQTAIGTFNTEDTSTTTTHPNGIAAYGQFAVIVGNGTSSARSNALTVDWAGNVTIAGTINDFIVAETQSQSTGSISANNGVELTISATKTGYTPIGIVGIRFTGASSGYCQPRQFRIDNGSAVIYAWNSHTSAHTWTAYCTVLYVKNAG